MLAARSLGRSPCRYSELLRPSKRIVTTRVVQQLDAEVTDARSANVQEPPIATTTPPEQPTGGRNSYPLSQGLPPPAAGAVPKAAELDAQRFRLHPSVEYWQNFTSYMNSIFDDTNMSTLSGSLQQLVRQATISAVLRDPQAASYWAYHTARMSFFIAQATTGLLAHHLSETLPPVVTGLAGGVGSSSGGGGKTPFQRIFSDLSRELTNRVNESLATFQQDYDNIHAGYYPMPWDMAPTHRQNNPLFIMQRTTQSVQETVATLRRRVREQPDYVWLSGPMYPQYYTKTYHYQTDGWMSDRSARVYEHNTEVLFFGRQDAMQRTSLLPVTEYLREADLAGRGPADMRLLEVAAGTGRFHTFLKDAYPQLPSVVSDLSPFYLARARENLDYWAASRQAGRQRQLGGMDGTGMTEFLQTAAESLDAPDGSFDILVCIYLFHELPEPVRRAAAREFFRVVRPGGLLVITDSVQTGDRPTWDDNLSAFGNFNEPYYRSYISTDLGALFEAAGFSCDTKYLCSASKTLSFRKPL